MHTIVEVLSKLLSYVKGAPLPILKALSERRGESTSKHIRSRQLLIAILEFLNKPLSYAKGAPIPILKALSERRGNRLQNFSARKSFACDF